MARMIYDPESGKMISEYELNMKSRQAKSFADKEESSYGFNDESGPIGKPVAKTDWLGDSNMTQNDNLPEQVPGKQAMSPEASGGVAAAQTAINGGSPLDVAGSGMTSAGMMSANPYLMGAGLGVSALSAVQKGKNQRDQNRYLAEVQKYNARQSSIEKMAQIAQGLKA